MRAITVCLVWNVLGVIKSMENFSRFLCLSVMGSCMELWCRESICSFFLPFFWLCLVSCFLFNAIDSVFISTKWIIQTLLRCWWIIYVQNGIFEISHWKTGITQNLMVIFSSRNRVNINRYTEIRLGVSELILPGSFQILFLWAVICSQDRQFVQVPFADW